jgi:hypothetical protein
MFVLELSNSNDSGANKGEKQNRMERIYKSNKSNVMSMEEIRQMLKVHA